MTTSRAPQLAPLRFITHDSPNANGGTVRQGDVCRVVMVTLEDGRRLYLEMGSESLAALRAAWETVPEVRQVGSAAAPQQMGLPMAQEGAA